MVCEAFADRAYNADGSLVSRRVPGAVIHEPEVIAARMLRLVTEGRITAIDGSDIVIEAQSICIHGDTAEAVAIGQTLRAALVDHGVSIRSFTDAAGSDG